jgi:hypothetical protein
MFDLLDRCSDFFRAPRFYKRNIRSGPYDHIAQVLKAVGNPHNTPALTCNNNRIVYACGCRPPFCHATPPENFLKFLRTVPAKNPPAIRCGAI